MKQARHKAYQFHYEAAMSKVLHEEARRKEQAREAKKNKKRKLLPVVEDPVVKVDRRKLKGKRKSTAIDDEGHGPFVVRLKRPDVMDVDDEHPRGHSFLAGRAAQRHLPNFPQPPSGDMTTAEVRAYERMAKSAEKRFDHFIASVWKDIAKKDIPKAYRQMDMSLKVKQSNAKKTVQLAAKEARRWQARSTKASKEMQIKAKKTMREVPHPHHIANSRCLSFGGKMRKKRGIYVRRQRRRQLTVPNGKKNSAKLDDKPENSTFSSPRQNCILTSSARKSESANKMNRQTANQRALHLFPLDLVMDKFLRSSMNSISMQMTMKHYVQLRREAPRMLCNWLRTRLKTSMQRLALKTTQPLKTLI